MATVTAKKNTISVPRNEYLRLKRLDDRFGGFFAYLDHLVDIREARKEIQRGKFVTQEKLFKRLGL